MCRLFGFRSVIQSQVHRSLLSADNALAVQSQKHPDGWGVAYYHDNAPHVIKGVATAMEDQIFRRVSGVVASETVLAHIRKATTGEVNILNSHPFQFGRWVFAHNGQIANYREVKEQLRDEIAPTLRRYVLGDTDSEILFYLFMSNLITRVDMSRRGAPVAEVCQALLDTVTFVADLADGRGEAPEDRSKLTCIVTDGHTMAAVKFRLQLFYSTHKTRCLDRDSCPYLAPECEQPSTNGSVNHLILSSEPLQGENVWTSMEDGEVVGVNWRMKLFQSNESTPLLRKMCEQGAC
ncbi:MAG: class II glutamine amidotransferase [Myxococcales bacterium]|nr:class II glutamine amidotransferase [Myxococcales bacterium]